jgi:hypothetical protein
LIGSGAERYRANLEGFRRSRMAASRRKSSRSTRSRERRSTRSHLGDQGYEVVHNGGGTDFTLMSRELAAAARDASAG